MAICDGQECASGVQQDTSELAEVRGSENRTFHCSKINTTLCSKPPLQCGLSMMTIFHSCQAVPFFMNKHCSSESLSKSHSHAHRHMHVYAYIHTMHRVDLAVSVTWVQAHMPHVQPSTAAFVFSHHLWTFSCTHTVYSSQWATVFPVCRFRAQRLLPGCGELQASMECWLCVSAGRQCSGEASYG